MAQKQQTSSTSGLSDLQRISASLVNTVHGTNFKTVSVPGCACFLAAHSLTSQICFTAYRFVQSVHFAHAFLISTTLLLLCVSSDAALVGPNHAVAEMDEHDS